MNARFTKYLLGVVVLFLGVMSTAQATPKGGPAQPSAESQIIKVQLNWNHQFEFAGFYAALAQGYYKELGLEVELISWTKDHEPLDAVLSGDADFGVGYSTLVVDYIKGAPIEIVSASFQYSPMILLSHAPVLTLEDLKNKTVMHHDDMQIRALLNLAYQNRADQYAFTQKSTGDLTSFIEKKVDLYAGYATNEPFRLNKLQVPYYVTDPKNYGIQSYGNLLFTSQALAQSDPSLVKRFNEATLKGWDYALHNQSEIVDYLMAHFPVVKTREDLIAEAHDTTKYVKFGKTPIGEVSAAKLQAIAVSAKETGLITPEQLAQADLSRLLFHDTERFLNLEELAYLRAHPVIELANDNSWAPFEFTDEQGRYHGLAADYFKLFEKSLGVKFKATPNQNWDTALQRASEGDLPVLSCAVSTPKRQASLSFTRPYLSFPMVLLARNTVDYIEDYNKLNRKVIAVTRGYWSQEYLEENFPQISLLLVNSVEQGIDAVLKGEAYGYSGNLAAINYALKKQGIDGLHIIGQADKRFELAIGVHKSEPMLLSILEKALNQVTPEQEREIYNRWIQLELVNKTDLKQIFSLIWPYLLGLLGMIGLWAFYVFYQTQKSQLLTQLADEKIKGALNKAQAAEQQLNLEKQHRQAQAKFFAMITHELKTPVSMIDGALQSLSLLTPSVEPEVEKRYDRIRRAANRINDLVQRFLQQDRLEDNQFELNIRPFALKGILDNVVNYYPLQRKIQFHNALKSDLLVADPALIELALSNLIDNAHKYSLLDKVILVSLEEEVQPNAIYWLISVADFGVGLDESQVEGLFEPYQRGQNLGDIPGVGLGLYLVKKIAKLHGGEVRYQSQDRSKGSIFTLKIPQNLTMTRARK
ncbi:ABC transporter substrate-binding protein [Thiosulfativibrio zosterae]|uniref:histidine kinase n=1 Tax=Thiosulfativibrio zosterae TaxID=2675053 RepID=A0A6F8PQN6_9GAMM|nr:transporter substrate-binding domain-containing protein [Thiosulfativibrio zosterae]BBP44396.1 hypothetical protein THMIRHAT_21420 [Thiosulfativibrio zosterae]